MSTDPRAFPGRSVDRRRFVGEWCVVACFGIALILWSAAGGLTTGLNRLVYDALLTLRTVPVSRDIVIVEIDNASIAALGRWPWSRAVHARFLEQLQRAQPAAIVYDVLFTEPSADDALLADALTGKPVYLPVLLAPADNHGARSVVEPVAPLATRAAGLGHINLEVDGDGIVRSIAMFEGDARWPHIVVPVWRAAERGALRLAHPPDPAGQRVPGGGDEGRFLIPFSPQSDAYARVSFASVLAGDVPASTLRNRIVLVGVTASGLYDRFATPVSGRLGPLPGVDIHANVLDALLTGREIEPLRAWPVAALSMLPLAVLLAGFLVLSPRRSLLLTLGLAALAFGCSALLLYGARLWMSPVPAIVGLIAVYPLWNWRRLEMTMSYLRKELQRLADEPYLLPEAPRARHEFGGDVLEQHMALMAQAAQRVQDMKRFVWDSLDSMPEPILVSDLNGIVLIANHAAKAHFTRLGAPMPEGRRMRDAFGELTFIKTIDVDAEVETLVRTHWPTVLDPVRSEFAAAMDTGIEVRDSSGRDHLLRYARCTNAEGEASGWIAGLVEVSALHAAERTREDALRLLSHDMRSPQASILALVEIERALIDSRAAQGSGTIEPAQVRDLLERIERYAQRSLTLADDFVQLARAESQAYALEPVNFADLMIDASDEVWPQAHAKQIQLDAQLDDTGAFWIHADRSLMTRALVNLLNNAVKYSPTGTRIACTMGARDGVPERVACTILDQGYGMSAEQQARMFEPFRRFHASEHPAIDGIGLGMAFVRTVVLRHGGEVEVASEPGVGTAVTIALPVAEEPATGW